MGKAWPVKKKSRVSNLDNWAQKSQFEACGRRYRILHGLPEACRRTASAATLCTKYRFFLLLRRQTVSIISTLSPQVMRATIAADDGSLVYIISLSYSRSQCVSFAACYSEEFPSCCESCVVSLWSLCPR